ncbi:MAG: 3-deoxy-8-phosphooctulonate synthase [bacterium]|nr:3-deoxy-8-phosphooctulonate synthase [bacterium]
MVNIGRIKIGDGHPLVLIAGPCVIESERQVLDSAAYLKEMTASLSLPFVFKSSYDKANRTSLQAYRGPGFKKGLAILQKAKDKFNIPILVDVHQVEEIKEAAAVADILQIPAFLCRQTDLVLAAARTGRVINIKKGQFLAPWDVENIVRKVESTGNRKIILTERGTSFGYNNLVTDMRSLVIMRKTGYPVIFDATHSVQLPGGKGDRSSGQSEYIPALARAAAAVGIDGLFLEVHRQPEKALSDGANMLPLQSVKKLLQEVIAIDELVKK